MFPPLVIVLPLARINLGGTNGSPLTNTYDTNSSVLPPIHLQNLYVGLTLLSKRGLLNRLWGLWSYGR